MKICYVADGQSVHVQKWVRYFVEMGHDVHLVTFDKTGQTAGVKVHNLKYFSKVAYPFRILEVRNTVKGINPNVLHAHYVSHYGMYAALAGFKPFVVTAWGSDVLIDPKRSMLKRQVVKYALRKADLITVDSISSKTAVVGFGVDVERVELVGHGVDLRMFHSSKSKMKFMKALQIPQSQWTVTSTRSLEPIYDIRTLIKAVPNVLEECPNTYFLIVGDGTLRPRLESLVKELDVTRNVRFTGSITQNDMPRYLEASDVYVSTSISDTTSVSLLEAMACELPVVVTDLEGNKEWIENEKNGFLFPAGDFKALAEKIVFLLRNEDIRKKFGAVNRRTVESKGDYEKEMRKMEKLYEKLVEHH